MSKVSIIVPVYNGVSFIDTCLESLCAQTLDDIQILVINDGSTDGSAEKCAEWESRNSRILVIHRENGGLSDARNVGIKEADGEYIMFVDCDDYIENWSAEKLYCLAKKQNLDVLRANNIIRYHEGNIQYKHQRAALTGEVRTGQQFFAEAYKKNLYTGAAWVGMYSRHFILENNLWFQKGIYHEDEFWVPQVLMKAKRVNYIALDFYSYIMQENSITHMPNKHKHGNDLLWVAQQLEKQDGVCREIKTQWKDLICGLYFYGVNTGAFIKRGEVDRLSKKFVLRNGLTRKNIVRTLLFVLNYKLYDFANDLRASMLRR